MYDMDDNFSEEDFFLDHDSAVLKAMAVTDKGLFDRDEAMDEDLKALYEN